MRRVIVTNIVSVDGFTADAAGNPVVLNMDAAFDAYNLERIEAAGTVLLGRTSFEGFSSYWPFIADAPADPGNRAVDDLNRAISRVYNHTPKVVVSDRGPVDPSNAWADSTTVVGRTDVADWLAGVRDQGDADILVFASSTMWNGLLAAGLVDELHLMVSPTALGDGTPAFTAPVALDLLEARRFDGSSNVLLRYAPAR